MQCFKEMKHYENCLLSSSSIETQGVEGEV